MSSDRISTPHCGRDITECTRSCADGCRFNSMTEPTRVAPTYYGQTLADLVETANRAPGQFGNSEIQWLAETALELQSAIAAMGRENEVLREALREIAEEADLSAIASFEGDFQRIREKARAALTKSAT